MKKTPIINKESARQFAKDWQIWAGEVSMSYSELAEWSEYFTNLANRFDLTEEFEENGII